MISLSIHTDFHGRFPHSYHLCSYAGLIPSTRSSGGITYHGSITKRGSAETHKAESTKESRID